MSSVTAARAIIPQRANSRPHFSHFAATILPAQLYVEVARLDCKLPCVLCVPHSDQS
uniref:Uncharacterized protein n=1 Tax=Arundo donax TaxID=35708 RepID=A0A0A9HKW1_ARUDO